MIYALTKLSIPGFCLETENIEYIRDELLRHIPLLPTKEFNSLSNKEQILELLDTGHGAEFVVEEFGTYEEYVGSLL